MYKDVNNKKVAVILGFYKGKKYLLEQLKSIVSQTHKNIKIFIFDDKSPNAICESKIYSDQKINSKVSIINRKENIGFARNFLLGLKEVGFEFDYYAFSDQDDIWEIDKIEKALKSIQSLNSSLPILYCSRTSYFNYDCSQKIGASKDFKKKKCFKNALVQNIAGGNTIVMNKKARDLVVKSLINKKYIAHDWWCYQLISAAGGKVIFDSKKSVRYRQHRNNIIGKNTSLVDKLNRFDSFFSGKYKTWCDINIYNLYINKKLLTSDNLETLDDFANARNTKNFIKKINLFLRSGVYRQSKIETLLLIIGLLLNKI